tara:strand:- start:251 stop:889 length:639 start_codon:yes stop_codon:yes gene_type:complete
MKYDKKYQFNEEWFDHNIPLWNELFKSYGRPIESVLEIGCYEGRATVYLCEKVLDKGTNYTVVDTFGGSAVEDGMDTTMERLKEDKDIIEKNFMHNISFHEDINFNVRKGNSQFILPELLKGGKKYDLIFIDASHRADDTLVDAYYAHKMLNRGGILIFDDFGWKDPNQPHPVCSPELGIRTFVHMYDEEYTKTHIGYQVVLCKNVHKEFKV